MTVQETKKRAYIGIDIGTSGVKALALDTTGTLLYEAHAPLEFSMPMPNRVEQNPDSWIQAVRIALNACTSNLPFNAEITGVGLSGQMLGCVCLGAFHRPLIPCMLWLDSRADKQCQSMIEEFGTAYWLEETANLPLSSYWAPKLVWLRESQKEVYEDTQTVLFPKDYVRLYLTGEIATEVSDASATTLFDMKKRHWNDDVVTRLGLRPDMLPQRMLESGDVAGRVTKRAAAETGLPEGIPVIAGGGDQAMGGIGNGIVEEGLVSSTIGTSGVVFACTDSPLIDEKQRAGLCYCHAVRDKWCFFGCTNTAGGAFQWLRNAVACQSEGQSNAAFPYERLTAAAAEAAPGSEGLIFLPYLNGERTPHMDADARGTFFGLSLRHGWNEIVRSVMEGITFSLRDCLEVLQDCGVRPSEIRASGGGARSNLWLQIQADVFNSSIVRMNMEEGPACGAAIAGMVSGGEFSGVREACSAILHPAYCVEPDSEHVKIYEDSYGLYRSLYPALAGSYKRHGELIEHHRSSDR